jgi:hypothetical protein
LIPKTPTKGARVALNNIELHPFGSLIFNKKKAAGITISEHLDYYEATAKEAIKSWASEAVFFAGLGEIANQLGLVIEIDETVVPVSQTHGRTALGFNTVDHPYEQFAGQDLRCTLRSFRNLEEKYRPKAVNDLVSKASEEIENDDEEELRQEIESMFSEMKDLFRIRASSTGGSPKGRWASLLRRRGKRKTPPFPRNRLRPNKLGVEWMDGPTPDFQFKLVSWHGDDLLKQPVVLREDKEKRWIKLEMNINHYVAMQALDLVAAKAGFLEWELVPEQSRQALIAKLENAGKKVFFRYWALVTGDCAKGYMSEAEREAALSPPQLKLALSLYPMWYSEALSNVKVTPQTRKVREAAVRKTHEAAE